MEVDPLLCNQPWSGARKCEAVASNVAYKCLKSGQGFIVNDPDWYQEYQPTAAHPRHPGPLYLCQVSSKAGATECPEKGVVLSFCNENLSTETLGAWFALLPCCALYTLNSEQSEELIIL